MNKVCFLLSISPCIMLAKEESPPLPKPNLVIVMAMADQFRRGQSGAKN